MIEILGFEEQSAHESNCSCYGTFRIYRKKLNFIKEIMYKERREEFLINSQNFSLLLLVGVVKDVT